MKNYTTHNFDKPLEFNKKRIPSWKRWVASIIGVEIQEFGYSKCYVCINHDNASVEIQPSDVVFDENGVYWFVASTITSRSPSGNEFTTELQLMTTNSYPKHMAKIPHLIATVLKAHSEGQSIVHVGDYWYDKREHDAALNSIYGTFQNKLDDN